MTEFEQRVRRALKYGYRNRTTKQDLTREVYDVVHTNRGQVAAVARALHRLMASGQGVLADYEPERIPRTRYYVR